MIKLFYQSVIICGLAALLAGCPGIRLNPGANKVKVTTAPAPKSCNYIGHVENRQINGFNNSYSSFDQILHDEITALRNQAQSMNTNLIVVTQHETTFVQRPGYDRVNAHIMAGNAYRCSASVLDKIAVQDDAVLAVIHKKSK